MGMVPNIIFSELVVYIKTGKQIQGKIDKALEIIRGDKYRWDDFMKKYKKKLLLISVILSIINSNFIANFL